MPTLTDPASPAERLENKAKLLADRMYERRKELVGAVGDRPYKGQPVSDDAKKARLGMIREDKDAWAQILMTVGRPKPDGRFLLPKKLVEEITKFEGERKQGTL